MAHPLEARIRQVRGQARRLLVLYALGWTVALLLGCVLLLGWVDYLIRFRDPGIRLMSSLCVVGVLAWAVYRFWYQAVWRTRLSDVQLAQRIERRYPSLTDKLSSTIAFLKQPEIDPQAGSAALRRAVIAQTSAAVESLDFAEVFESRPTRRALTVASCLALVALTVALAAPDSTRIAVARLASPWGKDVWPKFYSVEFKQPPTRLAAGEDFEVEFLRDRDHRLPDEIRLQYRFQSPTGPVDAEPELIRPINGVMVARRENVTRPFWYRAEGGDDTTMEWRYLEVVEPPRVETLELTLHPPRYSGLPVEQSEKSIVALRGTQVEIAGTSTKKLQSAKLRQESGELALQLNEDGYGFSLARDAAQPLVIDKSGPYWIELVDGEGLIGGKDSPWEIRAVPDQPPTVTIEQPSGNLFVTPSGEVSLKIVAKDDLALKTIALHFSRSDRSDVQDFAVSLYQGPENVSPLEGSGLLLSGQLGESRVVEHRWSLEELKLKPGTQLTFWATAGDYLPQAGESTVRRVSIITPGELEERLAQRQTLIVGELQRVLKLQQDARSQTRSLDIQLEQVGRLTKADVDHAQSAELNQRQVKRTLSSPTEGIPAQIADFLADLASNRVDSPDMQRHMQGVLDEIARLGEEHLNPAERDLTGLIKAAQDRLAADGEQAEPADPLVRESLAGAGEHQDAVIGSLERMLNNLGEWDNYRRFARDISQLQREQAEIAEATSEIGKKTLGRELKDLDAQQQADLKKLANQQVELSRRLDKTQQQMSAMSQSLGQKDPLSAAAISDGLHQAQQKAISGQMRQAGDQLDKNQLGQAAARQAQIAKDLEELLGILANRREQELSRLVKQLREAEADLARLRGQQAGLRKRIEEAAKKPDSEQRKQQLERLAREQKKLEEESARLARRLERLQAEKAGRSTAGAAGRMGQSGQAGQQGDAAGAEQGAEQAEKDLEEAQQQLAERRRQAEEDLAREQLARLEDGLKSLHERQKNMVAETERLENLRATQGRFTRAQLSTINDLARQQQAIERETADLAEKLSLTEVINLALSGAAKHMARAAELLEHRETGSDTQGAQQAARVRLAQLLAALGDAAKRNQPGGAGGDGSGSGGGQNSRSDGAHVLTQLKLLKIMQEELNSRFRALPGEAESPDALKQRTELAEEQGKLAELALKLSQPPAAEKPEDDPESLPDVRKEGEPAGEEGSLLDQLLDPAAKELEK